MDFDLLGFNGYSSNKQKWCQSLSTHTSFIDQQKTSNPDSATDFSLKEHNMLSFSTLNSEHNNKILQTEAFPFFQHPDSSYSKNAGYTGNNGRMCYINGGKWPFTTSQWIELEQQALIFKYIIANEPIPSHLLIPIKTALLSPAFSTFPSGLLGPVAYGWGPFQLGYPNNGDPEPGRCRRTDGKKWRCSKDAVVDHKYCERHMNRGRHRSRKPVEAAISGNNSTTTSNKTNKSPSSSAAVSNTLSTPVISRNTTGLDFLTPTISLNSSNNAFAIAKDHEHPESASSGFPFLSTDNSRLNSTVLWPKMPENTELSISMPSGEKFSLSPLRMSREIDPLEMGLGHGNQSNLDLDLDQDHVRWDTSIGGPLGEALKTTSNNNSVEHDKNLSALNLLSPTGVLRRTPLGSVNSSAGSSPRADMLENGRMFWEKISEFQ